MKIFLTVLFFLGGSFALHAQTVRCSTMESLAYRADENPELLNQINQVAAEITHSLDQNDRAGDPVYYIPVVVHVLYLADSLQQNLSDAIIESQIDVLNEDYRRLNDNAVNTRPEFLPVAGDAHIEFRLANVDPDGNSTNGITRTVGTPTIFGFPVTFYDPFTNNAKSDATGGKDPWPTNEYLNVWVCPLFTGLLGYAQFPGDDPLTDGVAIDYHVFGLNNPNATGLFDVYDGGRTTCHEVGHWLSLYHIWGDGDCTIDDGIADTPDADAQSQGCDLNKNTCTESSGPEFNDMVENYMDYSEDACMNMFTNGQINAMRTTLETERVDILSSPGWTAINETAFTIAEDVSVYPIPANENVFVEFRSEIKTEYSFTILNQLGQTVYESEILNADLTKINVDDFASGIYYVQLNADGNQAVKKFVKN